VPSECTTDFRRPEAYGVVVVRIGVADDEFGVAAAVQIDVGLGDVVIVPGPFQPGEMNTPLHSTGWISRVTCYVEITKPV